MAKGQDLKISFKGLWTAPANTAAPSGACLALDECVQRRPGLVEPRPGFSRSTAAFGSDVAAPRRILDFGSDQLGIRPAASSHTAHWRLSGNLDDESGAALAWYEYACKGQIAGKSLYLTTKNGIRKVPTAGGSVAYKIGAFRVEGFSPTASAASGVATAAVLANSFVAYRFVVKRTDANGMVTRSAPSSRLVYDNSASGTNQKMSLNVYLHPNLPWIAFASGVGDELEVYRTVSSASVPEDVEYLVKTVAISSTNISNRYVTVVDEVGDDHLTAALYTNEGEQGAEGAPGPTPEAKCLAEFQGSLFAANLTYPAQVVVSGGGVYGAPLARVSITFTNGSATATYAGASADTKGMIIENVSNEYSSNTNYVYVTNVSGTTITLSQTYTGTSGAKSRYLVPSLRLTDGTTTEYHPFDTPVGLIQSVRGYNGSDARHIATYGLIASAPGSALVTAYGGGDIISSGYDGTPYVLVLKALTTSATISVNGTDIGSPFGMPISPVFPSHASTAQAFAPDSNPNGIAWSKNLEHERFTLENYDEIGFGTKNILAILALKNAIVVFKEEGAWRVSGAGENSGFRIDRLDEDVRLLTHESATVLGDKVYAWTDKGIQVGDENAFENISNQSLSNTLNPIQQACLVGNTGAYGIFAVTNRKDDEVIFGVPAASDLTATATLLVYNRLQGSFVSWFVGTGLGCGAYRTDTQALIFATATGTTLHVERVDESQAFAFADHAISVTISAVSGLDVTISAGSGWTPAVGDMIIRSSTVALVTAVTDSTHFTVDTSVTSGACTAYLAYTSVITPIATTAKNPGIMKNFGEGSIWWSSLEGVRAYTLRFTSATSSTAVDQTRTVKDAHFSSAIAEAFLFTTPRKHARTTRLYPSVRITQAGSKWELEAMALAFNWMSDRVQRRR